MHNMTVFARHSIVQYARLLAVLETSFSRKVSVGSVDLRFADLPANQLWYNSDIRKLVSSLYYISDLSEDLCCVCLDRLPQVSLPCAHSFCPLCIQEWQLRSNSCPLCREESTVDEQWLLEEAPDLTEMERELRMTLTNLLRS